MKYSYENTSDEQRKVLLSWLKQNNIHDYYIKSVDILFDSVVIEQYKRTIEGKMEWDAKDKLITQSKTYPILFSLDPDFY